MPASEANINHSFKRIERFRRASGVLVSFRHIRFTTPLVEASERVVRVFNLQLVQGGHAYTPGLALLNSPHAVAQISFVHWGMLTLIGAVATLAEFV